MAEKCWWRDTLQSREKIKKKTSGLSQRRGFFLSDQEMTRAQKWEKRRRPRGGHQRNAGTLNLMPLSSPKLTQWMAGRAGRGFRCDCPPKRMKEIRWVPIFPKMLKPQCAYFNQTSYIFWAFKNVYGFEFLWDYLIKLLKVLVKKYLSLLIVYLIG